MTEGIEPEDKAIPEIDFTPKATDPKEGCEMVNYVSTGKMIVGPLLENKQAKACWNKIQKSILGYIGAGKEPGFSEIVFPGLGEWETVADETGIVLHESSRNIWFKYFASDWKETIAYLLALEKAQELFIEAAVNSINPTSMTFGIQKQPPFFGLNNRYDNPGIWFVLASCNFPVPAGVWEGFLDLLDGTAFEYEQDFEFNGGFTIQQWEILTKKPPQAKGGSNDSK